MVLAGAQGAVAVGTASSPSATAAPQAEKAARQSLDLSVHGVPKEFFAGGDAREFTFKVDNSTKNDFVLFPLLKFKNKAESLRAADLKVEYQLPGGKWLPASLAPGGDGDDSGVLLLLGALDNGDADAGSMLRLDKGTAVEIKVRASFTKNAPLGKAGVVPVSFSAPLDDKGNPISEGDFSCEGIKGAGFTIKAAPKPSPTPTASATTGKPSPTASPSASTSSSPTASPSASTSASPSASATASTSATASPSASTSATTVPSTPVTTGGPQEPIDFPVTVPNVNLPKVTPAVVSKAKTVTGKGSGKDLAATGGGDNTTAIAAAGGAVLAAGVGTLVVLRRRKAGQQG